ncbi:hypothetical protein D3C71_1943560 [compost metagenome]
MAKQIALEVEGQGRGTARGHEVADLQAHFFEVLIRRGKFILLIFNAQDGVLVFSAMVGLAAGRADADDRRLAEVRFVSA